MGLRSLLIQPCDAQIRVPPEVRKLLAKGAKVEAVNKDGTTALHIAANRGHHVVVRAHSWPKARRASGISIQIGANVPDV